MCSNDRLDGFFCNIHELTVLKKLGSNEQRLKSFIEKSDAFETFLSQFVKTQSNEFSMQNLQWQAQQLLSTSTIPEHDQ